MGQKSIPISLRLQKTSRHFDSSWYTDFHYTSLFLQELKIENYLKTVIKQIKYSEGRISVKNLPKKIHIHFFYFNPKNTLYKNNKFLQILERKKKKFSLLSLPSDVTRKESIVSFAEKTKDVFEINKILKKAEVFNGNSYKKPYKFLKEKKVYTENTLLLKYLIKSRECIKTLFPQKQRQDFYGDFKNTFFPLKYDKEKRQKSLFFPIIEKRKYIDLSIYSSGKHSKVYRRVKNKELFFPTLQNLFFETCCPETSLLFSKERKNLYLRILDKYPSKKTGCFVKKKMGEILQSSHKKNSILNNKYILSYLIFVFHKVFNLNKGFYTKDYKTIYSKLLFFVSRNSSKFLFEKSLCIDSGQTLSNEKVFYGPVKENSDITEKCLSSDKEQKVVFPLQNFLKRNLCLKTCRVFKEKLLNNKPLQDSLKTSYVLETLLLKKSFGKDKVLFLNEKNTSITELYKQNGQLSFAHQKEGSGNFLNHCFVPKRDTEMGLSGDGAYRLGIAQPTHPSHPHEPIKIYKENTKNTLEFPKPLYNKNFTKFSEGNKNPQPVSPLTSEKFGIGKVYDPGQRKMRNLLEFSLRSRKFLSKQRQTLFSVNGRYSKDIKTEGTERYNYNTLNSFFPSDKDYKTPYNYCYKSHLESILFKTLKSKVNLSFFSVLNMYQSADFIAFFIRMYLEKRVPFRRIKNLINRELNKNKTLKNIIKGVRISCSGRVGGKSKKAQRSKNETLKVGTTSLHVFSSKIDFAYKKALTPFGIVGIKVWVCFC